MSKNKKREAAACPVRKPSIGGQALMEGIMMRGPQVTAMAVRNTKGEIVLEKFPTSSGKRPAIWRIPIIRGVLNFADSMIFGYKCLMRSAEISGLEEAEEEMAREKAERKAAKQAARQTNQAEKDATDEKSQAPLGETATSEANPPVDPAVKAVKAVNPDVTDTAEKTEAAEKADAIGNTEVTEKAVAAEKKKTSGLMILITFVSVLFALAIAAGLFIFLPTFLYDLLARHVSWLEVDNRYTKSIFTGVLKVILLVAYMGSISLMKDIRRTFQYHGAEHKTIFCYEAGLELTVENVRGMKRFHPRCGTSFLILMVLVSILVGFFVPPALPPLLYSGIRILLVPVIVGIGYELIKFCGRHDNWLTKIISAPGVALQHITVFEPDDAMIECAIAAVREVIPQDGSDKW